MPEDLIARGLALMLFGMGTVISFLTLLVFATGAMSALVSRYGPEPPPQSQPGGPPAGDVPLVIAAALRKHRERP